MPLPVSDGVGLDVGDGWDGVVAVGGQDGLVKVGVIEGGCGRHFVVSLVCFDLLRGLYVVFEDRPCCRCSS